MVQNKFFMRNFCNYALQRIDGRVRDFDGLSVEIYESIKSDIYELNMGLDVLFYEEDALNPEDYTELKLNYLKTLNKLIEKFNDN